ncbi:MAG: hypothetical protein IPH81_18190 [Candidatus Microthrix sp.]|nr:hypothetical protein [Candidatus Microthrix sp.]
MTFTFGRSWIASPCNTKTEAVDLALRHLAGQPMSREEALAMRGAQALDVLPADSGPADAA